MKANARRTFLLGLALVLAALCVDRISLYWWGYRVLRCAQTLRNNLHVARDLRSFAAPATSPYVLVLDAYPKDVGSGGIVVGFRGAGVRPDSVRPYVGGLDLGFEPPVLAWTTRLFPLGGGWRGQPVSRLYELKISIVKAGDESGRWGVFAFRETWHHSVPYPLNARWPRFWPDERW